MSSSNVAESKTSEDNAGAETELWLPGQKAYTPSPGNGDRVFYETLLEQRPDSEMAQKWCVHHGVLDWDRAQELYAKICKREGKAFSPVKKPSSLSNGNNTKGNGNVIKKPVNKKSIYDDGDDIIGDGAGASSVWENRGSIGI